MKRAKLIPAVLAASVVLAVSACGAPAHPAAAGRVFTCASLEQPLAPLEHDMQLVGGSAGAGEVLAETVPGSTVNRDLKAAVAATSGMPDQAAETTNLDSSAASWAQTIHADSSMLAGNAAAPVGTDLSDLAAVCGYSWPS